MSQIFKGESVDDALTKAMIEMGLSSSNIEYKVLQEASTGFLGLGAKKCEVEVWKKGEKPAGYGIGGDVNVEKTSNKELKVDVKEKKSVEKKEGLNETENGVFEFNSSTQVKNFEKMQMTCDPDKVIEKAKEFLNPIFNKIGIVPEIEATVDKNENLITLDLKGQNIGVLIGKHGVTIDALQHLVTLVVNQNEKDKVRIRIDSENYRDKRKETLERLARSVANKVRKTRRNVELEPMSAFERRIIHSALQKEKNIETVSEGENKYRHIVIKYHR